MKKNLNCGFSKPWLLASFVRPPNAEKAGVRLSYIPRKARSNGVEHHVDCHKLKHNNNNSNIVTVPKVKSVFDLMHEKAIGIALDTNLIKWLLKK